MFQFTTIVVILFITTVINVFASSIAWRRRKKTQSGLYFALGMLGITFWTLAAGFDYAVVSISWKIFFAMLESWGYMTALPLFALVAISFAGYEHWVEKKWVRALLILVPASNILFFIEYPVACHVGSVSEQNLYPKGQNSVILRPLAAEIGVLKILQIYWHG